MLLAVQLHVLIEALVGLAFRLPFGHRHRRFHAVATADQASQKKHHQAGVRENEAQVLTLPGKRRSSAEAALRANAPPRALNHHDP